MSRQVSTPLILPLAFITGYVNSILSRFPLILTLLPGLCLATPKYCGSIEEHTLWLAFSTWTQLRHFVRLGGHQRGVLPDLLLHHEMEDAKSQGQRKLQVGRWGHKSHEVVAGDEDVMDYRVMYMDIC